MKYSTYNSIVKLTRQSSLLYNAVTDKFLVFKKELEPMLVGEADELAMSHPSFYKQLLDNGFLVEDREQEVKDTVEIGRKNCENESTYKLIINPTLNCNFRCWYCYEDHNAPTKMDAGTLEKIKRLVDNIAADSKIKHIDLSFFGGEPLLFYADTVRSIIDYVKSVCDSCNDELGFSVHFTSNGYLINDVVLAHLRSVDASSVSFQITLDGGRDLHNKVRYSTSGTGSYDRIIANVKRLLSNDIDVVLRINYTKQNIASVPSILGDLESISEDDRNHLSVDFQRVWQDEAIDNNDEQLNDIIMQFRKEAFRVSCYYNHVNSFRYPCYGDKNNECVVNYNGDVYKCTARDFTEANRYGVLSNEGTVIADNSKSNTCVSKYDKAFCHTCRIFPVCGACCTQRVRESKADACTNNNSEFDKDEIILMRFYDCIKKKTVEDSVVKVE